MGRFTIFAATEGKGNSSNEVLSDRAIRDGAGRCIYGHCAKDGVKGRRD